MLQMTTPEASAVQNHWCKSNTSMPGITKFSSVTNLTVTVLIQAASIAVPLTQGVTVPSDAQQDNRSHIESQGSAHGVPVQAPATRYVHSARGAA